MRSPLLLPCLLLTLALGYFSGRITTVQLAKPTAPLTLVHDLNQPQPTVVLKQVRNHQLEGIIIGDVRVFIGDTAIPSTTSGGFRVAAGPLLIDHIDISVPPGMHFFASKKGKKYYALAAKAGQRIAPGNRVYFATAAEAEAAGYTK